MANPNLELLTTAARLLQPLLDQLVFVGGCATGVFITDEAAADVRPTFDVDAIAEITSYAEYARFSERLRSLGFMEDSSEEAPICRWRNGDTRLDLMPLDEKILGFSNRWYKPAIHSATERELAGGIRIRIVTAPYFLATKLEAFNSRGKGDYFSSHDLEDVVAVVDGRPELLREIQTVSEDVRVFVAAEIARLLRTHQFRDALPGYLLPDSASQGRISTLLQRLEEISNL
jgi:hypothetical protein